MYIAKGSVNKFEIALNLVLFTRGIPVIFYGTEIGMEGGPKHGELRQPFPGGFNGDLRNAFDKDGRSDKEGEIYDYLKNLLSLRKEYPVLAKGVFRHIFLGNDIYLFAKSSEDENVLVMMNSGEKVKALQADQLKEFFPEAGKLHNLKNYKVIDLQKNEPVILNKYSTEIFKIN